MSFQLRLQRAVRLASDLRQSADDNGWVAVPHVITPAEMNTATSAWETGPGARTERSEVFISYCHKDRQWLQMVIAHLKPYMRNGSVSSWHDTQIRPGGRWRKEIESALSRAKVAVLLVTPHFLASDFVAEHELPPLLKAAESEGLVVIWIPVSASSYEETDIAKYKAAFDPVIPLDTLPQPSQNTVLVDVCKTIKQALIE